MRDSILTRFPEDYFLWVDNLKDFIEGARLYGKMPVIVALARKMQRYLKWCHESELSPVKGILANLHIYDDSKTILITEHAIPIVLPGCKPDTHEVCILDDLVVYGSSIEVVCENIYFCSGIKPYVIAISKTEEARGNHFMNCGIQYIKTCKIEDLPKFTTINSQHILSLQHPIDLEYCILSYDIPTGSTEKIRKGLLQNVASYFPEPTFSTYETKHHVNGKECSNITICKIQNDECYYHNSDFNKLRIFVSDQELKIVSYAPNIINDDDLQMKSPLFAETDFYSLWQVVYTAVKHQELSANITFEEYSYLANIIKVGYEHRKELTLVIWANYLSSFNNIISLKERIQNLLSSLNVTIYPSALQDLKLLLGSELCSHIHPQQIQLYNQNDVRLLRNHYADSEMSNSALIPEQFKDDYNRLNEKRTYNSLSIQEALSLIFTNMHYNIGLSTNTDAKNIFERYRFGECYNSLTQFLSTHFPAEISEQSSDLIVDIHKWIDAKIDLGIVVPKYEMNFTNLGRCYWKRYFRAGENEDTYIKLARECLNMTLSWIEENKVETFTKEQFISEILQKIIDRIPKEYSSIFSIRDFLLFDNDEIITAERVSHKLWSYLLNIPIFYPITTIYDTIQEYKVCNSPICQLLSKGQIL